MSLSFILTVSSYFSDRLPSSNKFINKRFFIRAALSPNSTRMCKMSMNVDASQDDWRNFRAKLVQKEKKREQLNLMSTWAHEIKAIEVGAILLSNPKIVKEKRLDYLNQSIFVVFEVTSNKVSALMWNKTTGYLVGNNNGIMGYVGAEFSNNAVFLGGDNARSLDIIHSIKAVSGSQELIPGLYRGGFNSSRLMVQEGKFTAEQFKIMTGYQSWEKVQLQKELDQGQWILGSCSTNLLLDQSTSKIDHLYETLLKLLDIRA